MTEASGVDYALATLVQTAIDDLAGRLGLAASDVRVASAQPIQWPDRSLGCPQPGMVYTQVSVDGARIELLAAGVRYDYHCGGSRGPFLCPDSSRAATS